jgi:DNA-binding transcriptional LysR family regulator
MIKKRRLLNLRGFQVFEAIARHRSITRAAEELGITQSAASHQLRNLGHRLGEELIVRRGQAITLTDAGRRLGQSLDRAFDMIEQEVTVMEGNRATLRVGTYSSFGAAWLIPRLPDFVAAHPEIDPRIAMLYDPHEISGRIADIFITSEPLEIGYTATRLFAEQLVPVAAASGPADFGAPMRLISAEMEPRIAGRAWEAFATLNDLELETIRAQEWLCCSHYVFALEMALAGMGAALLPDFMAARGIAEGRLRRLPGLMLPTGQSYEVHVPIERRLEPAIVTFMAWLGKISEEE